MIGRQVSCNHKDNDAHKDGNYNDAAIRKKPMRLHTNGQNHKTKESIRVNRNSTKF